MEKIVLSLMDFPENPQKQLHFCQMKKRTVIMTIINDRMTQIFFVLFSF